MYLEIVHNNPSADTQVLPQLTQVGLAAVLMMLLQHEPNRAQKEMYELGNQ